MSKLEISPEILTALQELSALLECDDSVDRTLQTVVDLSVATLPGCDSAGVTLRSAGQTRTAAASDAYALEIDEIQYDLGDGPCVEALESGVSVHVDSVAAETRWPEFIRRATAKGLRASLSQPLRPNGSTAALNLYATKQGAFDETAIQISEIFAKQATIALHNADAYVAARRLSEQLNEALRSRDLIGQAKGILMEREGIDDGAAFEMLRTASQNSNVKLRDVAQRIVDENLRSRRSGRV